jgi:hypothetical protein
LKREEPQMAQIYAEEEILNRRERRRLENKEGRVLDRINRMNRIRGGGKEERTTDATDGHGWEEAKRFTRRRNKRKAKEENSRRDAKAQRKKEEILTGLTG